MKKTLSGIAIAIVLCFPSVSFCQTRASGPGPAHASPQPTEAELEPFFAKLKSLAGPEAVNCGRVGVDQKSGAANKCARKAFKNGRAFYVVYGRRPTGSSHATALARNAKGQMWEVGYDSAAFIGGLPWHLPGAELSDSSRVFTTPCPTPYRLLEGRDGGVRPRGWKPERGTRLSCSGFGR